MKLKWFGHACFLLTSNAGTKVLMDPYDKKLGYKVSEIMTDVVTISHNHFDHNYTKGIQGDFFQIDKPGNYMHKDIDISGTLTYHDGHKGAKRGSNVIYTFTVDGIHLCHCGDLGHLLTLEQINEIGKIDILLINVGVSGALPVSGIVDVCKQLNPIITVPMHFRTKAMGLMGLLFSKVDKYLSASGEQAREVEELTMDLSTIKDNAGIIVMRY